MRPVSRAVILLAFAATAASPLAHIARADGERDTTFGDNGRVIGSSLGDVSVEAVTADPARRILIVGTQTGGEFGRPKMFVARYTSRGATDESFAGDGHANPTFLNSDDWSGGGDVVALADGSLLAGGTVSSGPDAQTMFALARYDASGSRDTTFDADGTVTTTFGTAGANLDALAVDAAGRYVAAGFVVSNGGQDSIAVARYRQDGSLDQEFARGGEVVAQMPGRCTQPFSAAVQRNNKIVVAGRVDSCDDQPRALVARYTAGGRLDKSFGGDGIVTTRIGAESVATGLILDGRERPVLSVNSSRGPRLVRFTRNGSRDLRFGVHGMTRLPKKVTNESAILDLVRQPDGRLLAAGTTVRGRRRFLLLRFRRNGQIDRGFGRDGRATIGFPRTASASALTLQGRGRAVVAGTTGDFIEALAMARVRTGTAR